MRKHDNISDNTIRSLIWVGIWPIYTLQAASKQTSKQRFISTEIYKTQYNVQCLCPFYVLQRVFLNCVVPLLLIMLKVTNLRVILKAGLGAKCLCHWPTLLVKSAFPLVVTVAQL